MGIRTFIAFPISQEIKDHLSCISKEINLGNKIRWVSPNSMHVTMKFLGDVEEDIIEYIEKDMVQIAYKYRPCQVEIASLGVFPNMKAPTVLWAGMQGNLQTLQCIYKDLQITMEEYGIPPEKRNFSPHITLTRFPKSYTPQKIFIDYLEKNKTRSFGKLECKELILYKSELRPTGAIYTPLSRASLNFEDEIS
ncbi:MAG TPA: RNA 2',3'-cyclic phosphodiesterase [Planctomycetota bacterium]|nr:RNA 2',3'-cyclic phosphodiesterase [Planctomycetota bacterium]HQA99704.1 RNA 2',3'-cyclic phosphodiesterase [Planctomycetota bacterium]HRU51314.1 RNA 2',3'-cyclic phosphodiesterase [Planctomycetota bacterium]